MTREKAFKRSVRQRMGQTGEKYTAARAQVLQQHSSRGVAITNGDSVGGTLKEAGLAGEVIAWLDVLHDGPVPALEAAKLRKVRATHLSQRYGQPLAEVEHGLAERDARFRRHVHDTLTLWFEADLHDQLQLIQILSRLHRSNARPASVTMISISEHPDRPRFGGLGELSGGQLAALLPMARRLSGDGFRLSARAWTAFTRPDPSDLITLQGVISSELRYVGDAIGRLLQEYPSRSDGLSLTQRRILLAVDAGRTTFAEILRSHWRLEPRPFLGDLGCRSELELLAESRTPALAKRDGAYTLTAFGRRLLAGEEDWVAINGIDRWIGGVHLIGEKVAWRYDERLERLIAAG